MCYEQVFRTNDWLSTLVVRGICERSTCVADGHVNLHLWCVAVDPETSRSPRQYGSGLVGRFVYRYYYSAPIGERIIVISVSVCLSVCVFVCPRLYLRNYTSDLRQIFCACYLWPWLDPPLTA